MNNEVYGISAEISLCDVYDIPVNDNYRKRSDSFIVEKLHTVSEDFKDRSGLLLNQHIAEGGNPHDFLAGSETISIKSNKNNIGRISPQVIGQCTSNSFYYPFIELCDNYSDDYLSLSYSQQAYIFKKTVMGNLPAMLDSYWDYMNNSDYFVLYYHITSDNPKCNLIDVTQKPLWGNYELSTTRSLSEWNESNTIKLDNKSIGEFQVHNNRNNFKFRFNLKGLLDLGIIKHIC